MHPTHPWRWAAIDVAISDLNLLSNPADLLNLHRFRERLKEIIDAVDVVCRSGRTRTDSLKRSTDLLRQGANRVAGIVLNVAPTVTPGFDVHAVPHARPSTNSSGGAPQ